MTLRTLPVLLALQVGCSSIPTDAPQDGATETDAVGTSDALGSTSFDSSSSTGSEGSSSSTTSGPGDSSSTTAVDPSDSGGSSDTTEGLGSSSTGDGEIACTPPMIGEVCNSPSPSDGTGACDSFAQDCPAGQKCVPVVSPGSVGFDSTACRPADPMPVAIGQPCENTGTSASPVDNCEVGAMCRNNSSTGVATCVELCGCGPDQPTCQGEDGFCSITADGNVAICVQSCDPLAEGECGEGEGCYFSLGDGAFLCWSTTLEPAALGEPCEAISECEGDLTCVYGGLLPDCETLGCCTSYCDVDEGGLECELAGTTCVPFFDPGDEPDACHADTGRCIAG